MTHIINDSQIRSGSADPEYASNCEIFLRTTVFITLKNDHEIYTHEWSIITVKIHSKLK